MPAIEINASAFIKDHIEVTKNIPQSFRDVMAIHADQPGGGPSAGTSLNAINAQPIVALNTPI
jgi:hypothetical protein